MKNILCLSALCAAFVLATTGCQMNKVTQLETENQQLKSKIIRSDSIQTQFINARSEIEYNLSEIRAREKSIDKYSNEPNIRNNSKIQEKILEDIAAIGRLLEDNRVKLANMASLQKQLVMIKAENTRLKNLQKQFVTTKEENARLKKIQDAAREQRRQGGGYYFDNSTSGLSKIEMENRATQKLYEEQQKSRQQTEQQRTATANTAASAEILRLQALNQSLRNTIDQLHQQVAESEARIEALQEELILLKEAYAALQAINESLQAENDKYKDDLAASRTEIDQKDAEISRLNEVVQTAFYYIGPKKEASAKGLIVKSGSTPAYKDADFIRIENIFEKKMIETNSAKPIIISNHPSASYSFDTKDKTNVKIMIKNPDQFWKITKYLIVVTPK